EAVEPVTSHLGSLRQQLDSLLMGRSGPSPTAWMRKIPSPLEVETIWHVKELVQHLLGNFKALGLNTQMAREMALAVVTGAASGQLVSFAGSFACDVAEACALSLNGENSWTLSLGVGVTSEQIASAVEARVDRTERWTSVVLEGLNCVPFDIVRGAVRMLMPLSQKRVLLLATISDDLTALPIDPNLFKQGPLFQLDCLTWKLASTQRCSASFAGDIVPAMAEIRGLDIGEALGEDSDFPRLDHLWRRMVYSASLVYAAVAGEEAKILPGISFGWILPYLYQFRQELVDSNQEQLIGDSPCAIRLMKDKKDELQ
ncbi:MAG: hypothetical protein M1415_05470, partial [Firmicutes bacterium]|nr:hypothetical protein [Bacillota bacterium]